MKTLTNLYKQNFHKIFLAISLAIILLILFQLPYFNIYLSPSLAIIVFYIFLIFLFKISSKVNLSISILCFIIALPWLFVGSRVKVEPLGVLAFLALLIAVIQEIIEVRKSNE